MKLVPMHPNLPEATSALGTVIKPKQWYECVHCKKLSPLEEREWQGLTVDEFYDLDDVGRKMILEYGRLVEAKLREKNT